jgi:hypothetical protein
MPLESQQDPRWPQPLASRLGPDAGVEQIVETIMTVWREIEEALRPIIGHRGVAALFNRSLTLVSAKHPWLRAGLGGALVAVDPTALWATVLQQSAAVAAAGGAALFQSLHDLLASLVGATLTGRLLRSVWAPYAGAPPAQDLSP